MNAAVLADYARTNDGPLLVPGFPVPFERSPVFDSPGGEDAVDDVAGFGLATVRREHPPVLIEQDQRIAGGGGRLRLRMVH